MHRRAMIYRSFLIYTPFTNTSVQYIHEHNYKTIFRIPVVNYGTVPAIILHAYTVTMN